MDGRIQAAIACRTRSFSVELIAELVGATRIQAPDAGREPEPNLGERGREKQVS